MGGGACAMRSFERQMPELSIVIPARNEEKTLPLLLASLCRQDYPKMRETKILVADGGSTDATVVIARGFCDRLNLEVIAGGLPAVGRNAGARRAQCKYVLFLDADVELSEPTLLRRTLEIAAARGLHCATTNIACRQGGFRDDLLYAANNFMQWFSRWTLPFSTGMFMLFEREAFWRLGGFHERALFAEDYLLSKQVARARFTVVRGHVLTGNRRFRKLGYTRMVAMFFKTMLHSWNESYFLRDHGYWAECGETE